MKQPVLYLDFDGVIADTIATIVKLYNEDYMYYKDYELVQPSDIYSWDFTECKLATKEEINRYFNTIRFFKEIKLMPDAKKVIRALHLGLGLHIKIVSHGYSPNLRAKRQYIEQKFPECEFIGVNLKEHDDKACIDMSDGIFVDDSLKNLESSNAAYKIVFGSVYPWNQENTEYDRIATWDELLYRIRTYLKEQDGEIC